MSASATTIPLPRPVLFHRARRYDHGQAGTKLIGTSQRIGHSYEKMLSSYGHPGGTSVLRKAQLFYFLAAGFPGHLVFPLMAFTSHRIILIVMVFLFHIK